MGLRIQQTCTTTSQFLSCIAHYSTPQSMFPAWFGIFTGASFILYRSILSLRHFIGAFSLSVILQEQSPFPSFYRSILPFRHFIGAFSLSVILQKNSLFPSFYRRILSFHHFIGAISLSVILQEQSPFPAFSFSSFYKSILFLLIL